MKLYRDFCAIAATLFLASSCTIPRTQVLVVINGDSVVQREATAVEIRVTTAKGVHSFTIERQAVEAQNGSFFPLRIPIAARDAGATYQIEARALKAEATESTTLTTRLAINRARSSFVAGRVLTLPLWLLSGCMCDESQRCVPGPGQVPVCTDINVVPGEESVLDSGIDAGRDGGDGATMSQSCTSGFHLCGTACLPNGDVNSCGQMCTSCATVEGGTAVCVGGACGVRCNGAREMCGSACIDTASNQSHCGACDRPCTNGQICQQGACREPPECSESNLSTCPSGTYCNVSRCAVGCDENADCGDNGVCNLGTHECGCAAGSRRCGGICATCPGDAASTACNAQNQCVAASCNTPQILCGGACTMESVQACGAGCTSCSVDNGIAACVAGSCAIVRCVDGYRECANTCAACPSNAASTSCSGSLCVASACGPGLAFCGGQCVPESASQCGANCGSCTLDHGTGICSDGSCGIASCDSGYRACGGVCAACPSGALQTSCSAAQCVATACDSGSALCGGQCVPNSVNQCGPSCSSCSVSNGVASCSNGVCGVASCNAGYRECNGACARCPNGATSTTCNAGGACIASACDPGFAFCSGQCVPESASQCGNSCSACSVPNGTGQCNNGVCGLASCNSGYRACGGACAACPSNTASTTCDGMNRCIATACAAGFANCGGQCVANSINGCGATCTTCSVPNGTAACTSGNCAIASCNSGYRSCAGVCAMCPTGAVNTTCSGMACIASSCSAGLASCGGQCVPESTSQCGNSCQNCTASNGTPQCSGGSCSIASCNMGYRLCGGTCAACPSGASSTSCSGSNLCVATACSGGLVACGGQCVTSNISHCGAGCTTCSVSNGTPACNSGSCAVASCNAGYQANGSNTACLDINECLTNNGNCGANTTCSNSAGSFACNCVAPNRTCGGACVTCPSDSNASATACSGGTCVVSACNSGYRLCGGSCVLCPTGASSTSCNASNACIATACSGGLIACGGTCQACIAGTCNGSGQCEHVFTLDGNITRPTGAVFFGDPVALSGDANTLVAADAFADNGRATSYSRSMGGAWSAGTNVTPPPGTSFFGGGVALSANGTTLAVGDSENGNGGTVTVYTRTPGGSSGTGTQVWRPGGAAYFGKSVSLSSDGLVLAAGDITGDGGSGSATVYTRSAGGPWSAGTNVLRPNGAVYFGGSVALSANGLMLAVGDSRGGGDTRGAVRVYTRPAGGVWDIGTALVRVANALHFGVHVALSNDGNILAVTDYGGGSDGDGAVTTYSRDGSGVWSGPTPLPVPTVGGYYFGTDIALAGDGLTMAVADRNGVVNIYGRTGAIWGSGTLLPFTAVGAVGLSLSTDGTTLAVGDPGGGGGNGVVAVFSR